MTEDSLILRVFFTYCWKNKPTHCQCCKTQRLPQILNTCCMDHLLEKSNSPECKYSISNIFFVCESCHSDKTAGYTKEEHKKAIENAKENYDKLVIESLEFKEKVLNLIK